jgi:hypothetical protein
MAVPYMYVLDPKFVHPSPAFTSLFFFSSGD